MVIRVKIKFFFPGSSTALIGRLYSEMVTSDVRLNNWIIKELQFN